MTTNTHDEFLAELQAGEWLPLPEVCKLILSPKTGKRLSLCTAMRWCLTGKLPAIRQGRFWYVHKRDIAALFTPHVPRELGPSRREMDRQHKRAVAKLKKMGVNI